MPYLEVIVAGKNESYSGHDIVEMNREFTFFSWSIQNTVNPIPMDHADGVNFWDAEGKQYLDFSSQLMNLNIGHQHPKVIKAIQDQASQLCFAHPGIATKPRGLLGKKIAEVSPGNLKKTFFCLGGAEANENAIKMARIFSGRNKLLARYRSYHGATHGAIALTGDYRRLPVEPALPGVVHFLDPYCYRCPFGWTIETCHRECIDHVEEIIQYEGADQIAAIFMEGVTGSNGLIVPPDDYWPRIREICDKYDILLVSDEVMSGWGRTGKWFAVDNWNVVPDMITTAKGLTAGYVPLGAVIVSDTIADFFEDKMLWCGLTYSGHPLACAAGVATLEVYEEDGLLENAANLGKYLGQKLEEIKVNHPSVGDVRYIGLFSTIELVKDRRTKDPMPANIMAEIGKFLKDHGLFTFIMSNKLASMVFIVPPLCITKEQLNGGIQVIEQALSISDQTV
ncbi:MAG: aminotransferase class III-fold pyridoxal phosphate-dependent enzyme [Anaerolineales bacterium]|nr:aminotransferase class III-fold pyridoxal phosphate-dependent enzyme [Anaerolineales bacterium]